MSVEHTILRCLVEKPAHGYEISHALRPLKSLYPLGNVNVYPVLRNLEREGLVCASSVVADSRLRRVYEITPAGKSSLKEWLASPPESALAKMLDPLMLRLVLETDPVGEIDWLADAIAEVTAESVQAAEAYATRSAEMNPITRIAVEELIDNLDRRRAFLERVLALVAK